MAASDCQKHRQTDRSCTMPFVCKAALFAAAIKLRRIICVGNAACMTNVNIALENLKGSEIMKDRIFMRNFNIKIRVSSEAGR